MQRVFIGIPVDKPAQLQINELLVPLKNSYQGIRWVPEQNRHLTLAFLGNRPIRVIKNLIDSMDDAYRLERSFQTPFSTLRRFPKPTGNIIALETEAATRLAFLYQITQKLLAENGLISENSPFRPHITLGRVKQPSSLNEKLNQPVNINLQVDKITLYQSTLTETGSIYLSLKDIELGQADRRPA